MSYIKFLNRFNSKCSPMACIIILVFLFIFLSYISLTAPVHKYGDTSTYYMQVQSISEDSDIQYEEKDILRVIEKRFDDIPMGLYLIKTADGRYFFGKEFSYALFASPFYKGLGDRGLLFFNSLLFFLMVLMGYVYLRRSNSESIAFGVSISFFVLSAAFIYIFWIHVEIYNMFLLMLGLFLWLQYRKDKHIRYLAFASLILGIAATAKVPNILLYFPLLFLETHEKRWKNVALMLLAFMIPIILSYGYFYIISGEPSFYGGDRLYYNNNYPFMNGYDNINEAGRNAFSIDEGRISALINIDNLKIIPYNFFYYFFGRFTGMIWYYPFALFALLSFFLSHRTFRGSDRFQPERALILAGILLNLAFFVAIIGNNYFGGAHAVGNRYFYIYPAFLFLLKSVDIKKFSIFLLISMVTTVPLISDPVENSISPEGHTFEYPYIFFPLEYSQLGNLPIWQHHCVIDKFHIYWLDNSCRCTSDVMQLGKHAELLIVSSLRINSLSILLISKSNGTRMNLITGDDSRNITLAGNDAKIVTISDMPPEYYDNRIYVYKIYINSTDNSFMKLTTPEQMEKAKINPLDGWHGSEIWDNVPTRWMEDESRILLYPHERSTVNLSFQAQSFSKSRTLEIYSGDELAARVTVPTSFINVDVPIHLANGSNIVRLHVIEGCERPCDRSEKNQDSRCLSVAVQNIAIS